jgi:hypothetical protein
LTLGFFEYGFKFAEKLEKSFVIIGFCGFNVTVEAASAGSMRPLNP